MFVEPVLKIATSARGDITVCVCEFVAEPSLFVGFGSNVPVVPNAMFVKLPPSVETAVTVKLVVSLFARLKAGQLTRLLETIAVAGSALTNWKPAGSRSFTDTFVAVDGPRFVTVIV